MIMIAVMGIQALVVHGGETPDHTEFQTHLATGHDHDHGHHHPRHHHHHHHLHHQIMMVTQGSLGPARR